MNDGCGPLWLGSSGWGTGGIESVSGGTWGDCQACVGSAKIRMIYRWAEVLSNLRVSFDHGEAACLLVAVNICLSTLRLV